MFVHVMQLSITLFSVGYLVLEYQTAGTGVSDRWYWSIRPLVLEYQTAGTGVSNNCDCLRN